MVLTLPKTDYTRTGSLNLPNVKVEKKENEPKQLLPSKKTSSLVLPKKKVISEAEKYNRQQDTLLKKVGRVLLPKKYESKFGVEKIEKVKSPLVGGYERLTPEQKIKAKQVTRKELPTELKPKLPSLYKGLVGEASVKDVPFIGSGKEAVDLFKIAGSYKRVSQNKGTEKDKQVLNDYYDEEERKQEERKNIGYRAGETVRGSARFMGELVPVALSEFFTGTIAPTGEAYAVSQAAKLGTLKTLKKALTDKVVRDTVKKSVTKNVKTLSKQMVVTGATNIPRGTAERLIGVVDTETGEVLQKGQPVKEAIINSVTGHAVELATEMGGGISGKALSGLTKPARNYVTKSAIFKALKKKLGGSSDKQIESLLSRVGWNGVIGEFFEERDADILNEALYQVGLGDQEFQGLTKDDVATELIAFSLMGGGIKVGTKIAEGLQTRKDLPPKKEATKLKLPEIKPTEKIKPTKLIIPEKEIIKKEIKLPPKKVVEKKEVKEVKVEEQPLTKEARKYKSAEEFIEAQPKAYHGTLTDDAVNIEKTGFKFRKEQGKTTPFADDEFFGDVVYLTDNKQQAKRLGEQMGNKRGVSTFGGANVEVMDISTADLKLAPKPKGITNIKEQQSAIAKLKEQGYDGVYEKSNSGNWSIVWNKDKLKTKSQLTDIWKKATAKPTTQAPKQPSKPVKVEKAKVIPKEVKVPREQLPIQTGGKEKVSRLEARTKNALGKLTEEKIDELGLATYNELNKKENIKNASEYVSKNPKEALEVLKGNVEAPKGILRNSILVALQQASNENVELATKLSSLFSTRAGQELSILTELDQFSPAKIMSDIINIKEKKISKQFKKSKTEAKKEMKDKIEKDTQKRVKKARKNKKTFYNLVDELKC